MSTACSLSISRPGLGSASSAKAQRLQPYLHMRTQPAPARTCLHLHLRLISSHLIPSFTVGTHAMDLKTSYTSSLIRPFYVGTPAAAVSANGLLVCTPMEEDVHIVSMSTGVVATIEGDGELVTNVVLSADGQWLAVLSQSQQLRVFNIASSEGTEGEGTEGTGARLTHTHKMLSPIYILATDLTSSLFAFGGADGAVTVWDIAGGFVTHLLKGHGTTVSALAFAGERGQQTGWRLASGDIMGTAKVWDLVRRGKCIATASEHTLAVRAVAFGAQNQFLTAGRDEVVVIYNEHYKPAKTISVGHLVEAAGFVDEAHFYTAGSGNSLQVWSAAHASVVRQLDPGLRTSEELVITDVRELSSGDWFVVVSDQTLCQLDRQSLRCVRRVAGNHGIVADMRYVGPAGELVALATNLPAVRIVDLARPMEVVLLEGHTDLLNGLDASRDGRWLASAGKDGEARLWQWDDAREEFALHSVYAGHAGSVTAVAMALADTPQGPQFVVTGSTDLTVKRWRVPAARGERVTVAQYTRRAHDKDINAIAVAPNDELFATALYDKLAKVWLAELGETVGVLKGHKRGLWDISFCHYDKLVVTALGDKLLKVWSLRDYTCAKTLEGHTNLVQRARFVTRAAQVISAGADGLLKVWDLKSEEAVQTLDAHDNRVWAFDVAGDGAAFVLADADGVVAVWRDNSAEVERAAAQQHLLKVEQEQRLQNYIGAADWSNAFLLALTLNHPMRLYNVFRLSIAAAVDPASVLGSHALERTMRQLSDDQVLTLFQKCRAWNVNLKLFEVLQKVVQLMLRMFGSERLVEIRGLPPVLDGLVAYSERHYARLDDLVELSYMLDYTIEAMNTIA